MNLLSIGITNQRVQNYNQQKDNVKCLSQNLQLKPQLNTDKVQFTGATKVLSNIYDKAFVDILAKDLDLTKEAGTKLKNIVWNFLRENKKSSLGELGGEEFFDEQVELVERITKKLNLPDDVSEFVADEVVRRCENGEKYTPGRLRNYRKDQELESLFRIHTAHKFLDGVLESNADNRFYEYARKALRLSPLENYEFKVTIEDYLKGHKLNKITDLAGIDRINEQAELVEILGKKFNLSDAEINAIEWELISRANSGSNYKAIANVFVKDSAPFEEIINRGGYNYKCNDEIESSFSDNLFSVMSHEAGEKGLNNIFDIFLKENNPKTSKTYNYIQNSSLSKDQKTDLIIDLGKAAKDRDEIIENAPKHVAFDNFYSSIYNDIITEQIIKRFDIPGILEDDISKMVAKIHPKHVQDGENCSISQVAFELADKYKLPVGAEREINAIIEDVLNGGTKSADVYVMKNLMKDIGSLD